MARLGPRIGEILVREGACTPEAVREALQNQVIFGGRLGTNLLELGAVTEEALAKALGERHGVPSLHGNLPLDERVTALVRPDVADRCDAVPYFLADRRLALLVCDPGDLGMLDEVAFASGKQVHPIVVPEARVWALLRKAYGIERQLRGIEVDWARLEVREGPAAPSHPTAAAAEAASAGLDLMAESEFEAMYGAGTGGRAAPEPGPAQARGSAPPPPAVRAAQPPATGAPPPPVARAAPPEPEEPILELTDLLADSPLEEGVPDLAAEAFQPLGEPLAPGPAAVLAALSRAPGHAPPARLARPAERPEEPEPEPTPLRFDEAVSLLAGVDDRGAIARTVLRYARSKFRRALLLTVNRGAAQGWAGLGEKLTPDAVRRVRLRLGAPGIVETVVSTRAHFLGPIPKTEANVRLLKQLGGGVPGNAFLVPILARGRVVNVFYADNGRGAMVDAGDLGELLILATRIAQGYETLLGRAV
ncbi:MAG TPA: hypothetical protein VLS93_10980 [Anaeromyxobacteraceae bacterium]|nr:hypothetical protein [Anaeromyxobacteraceae bacterium]